MQARNGMSSANWLCLSIKSFFDVKKELKQNTVITKCKFLNAAEFITQSNHSEVSNSISNVMLQVKV